MNAKRKSTLGTRRNTEVPSRLAMTNVLKMLTEVENNDGPRSRNATQLNSTCKKPKTSRMPTQTTSNRDHASERPVNRKLYKRSALKPANSIAVHKKESSAKLYKRSALKPANAIAVHKKESSACPDSVKKLMSRRLKNTEEATTLTGGLRIMREREARARATRILSTPNSRNIVRKGETLGSSTPKMQSYETLAQLTPQNQLFKKYKSDFPCSVNQNNVTKRQYKSTAFEFLPHDTGCLQTKQKLFCVSENKMDHMNADVIQSNFGNKNQENLAQECQKTDTSELTLCSLGTIEQQKENITNVFPSALTSSLQNLKPSFLHTNSSQNFSSACNTKVAISQTKPNTPRLNHIPVFPSEHFKTPTSSQNISSTEMLSLVKSQASEQKQLHISSCCYSTENILNFPSERNSVMQRNINEEIKKCSSMDAKDDRITNKTEAIAMKEDIFQGAACSLKKPQKMEIMRNLLNLQDQCKVEMELFMERMNALQNQQSEMLQKLSAIYQTEEETNECKQNTSFTEESKASSSTHRNTEMESAEPEKVLVPISEVSGKKKRRSSRIAAKMNGSIHSNASTPDSSSFTEESKASSSSHWNIEMESAEPEKALVPISEVSGKKKRRSSRIAAKMNSSIHSNASTPGPYDKSTTVVAIFKDLRKSFTFLRTPRDCKSSPRGKTPLRTPRTIVSTSIQNQLQLLYDTDSPE